MHITPKVRGLQDHLQEAGQTQAATNNSGQVGKDLASRAFFTFPVTARSRPGALSSRSSSHAEARILASDNVSRREFIKRCAVDSG